MIYNTSTSQQHPSPEPEVTQSDTKQSYCNRLDVNVFILMTLHLLVIFPMMCFLA